jgi:anti-anti-sigma factor
MTTLQQQDTGGVRVVRVTGSLTQQDVDRIEPAFESALPDGARAVVDLAEVDVITTPGIALIISTSKRLRQTEGRVIFAGLRGGVLDVFKRCKLDDVLELADDPAEAVRRAKD